MNKKERDKEVISDMTKGLVWWIVLIAAAIVLITLADQPRSTLYREGERSTEAVCLSDDARTHADT